MKALNLAFSIILCVAGGLCLGYFLGNIFNNKTLFLSIGIIIGILSSLAYLFSMVLKR